MDVQSTASNVQFGTPKELGVSRDEYLPRTRQLYKDNARGLLTKLSDEELAQGTLRKIPFFKFFDERVQYQPDMLQLAKDEEKGIVGFFGSPIDAPTGLVKWYLNKLDKEGGIEKVLGLKEALDDEDTIVYINTSLCVDKDFRKRGIAKELKNKSENKLKAKHSSLADQLLRGINGKKGPRKLVLITGHESNNEASSKTQDARGYYKVFDYKYPWPFPLKFTIRAKVIDLVPDKDEAKKDFESGNLFGAL